MSINDYIEKIKLFLESEKGKDLLTVLILVLVGLGSFGIGRMSTGGDKEGLKIDYKAIEDNIVVSGVNNTANVNTSIAQGSMETILSKSGNYFASSRGTKYYSVSCSAGKTIKTENRIYFVTREEVEKAGYELSSSCR